MMSTNQNGLRAIVPDAEWRTALEALRAKEKALTRAQDELAAQRRRLPMVEITKTYTFESLQGPVTLLDLFEDRRQLLLYHFMFHPDWQEGCVGCSMMVDNMGHPAHLHARDTSRALVSRAPLTKLEAYRARMGWTVPWVSSLHSDFNHDFGVSVEDSETFALSAFLRDDERVFRSYVTDQRGVEHLGSNRTYVDLTPLGRAEEWEDTPARRPRTPAYRWWRRHDRYGDAND